MSSECNAAINNELVSDRNKTPTVDMTILETKLGYQIRMADRLINRDFVQNAGMTPVQYSVFTLVASNPGLSQVAIGDSLGMDRASTMAIVRKLEKADLIECRKAVHDRRMQALFLTPHGEKEFKLVNKRVTEYDNRIGQRLTAKEREQFLLCIAKLRG